MPEAKIYINGINGVTGQYLVRPRTPGQLLSYVTGESDKGLLGWLAHMAEVFSSIFYGVDHDWTNIQEVGWGIVFHQDENEAVKSALQPLIRHRRDRIGNDQLVKVMEYRQNDSLKDFLGRYGSAPGASDPLKVPFYLLLVGSPARIPFNFGHLLDIEYAVGRLHFDTVAEYQAYVQSVIAYETAAFIPNARQAVFFGTRHKFDTATQLSADQLVTPLADGVPALGNEAATPGIAQDMNFQVAKYIAAGATQAALTQIFAPPPDVLPPAFLFTASHGVGWPNGHVDQLARQGALLCQDWPGFGKINPAHYFSAANLPPDARLQGLITFHFACYGAGTPARDRFIHKPGKAPPPIAPNAFIAALPKALLSHPSGAALAVIGHVERAWGYSIATAEAGAQIKPLRNTIGRILEGLPVGYAVKNINERYTVLSTNLTDLLERKSSGEVIAEDELAACWIERNDAEGYVVLGDPAVHLRVDDL